MSLRTLTVVLALMSGATGKKVHVAVSRHADSRASIELRGRDGGIIWQRASSEMTKPEQGWVSFVATGWI